MADACVHYEALLRTNGMSDVKPTPTDLAILASANASVAAIKDLERQLITSTEQIVEAFYDYDGVDDLESIEEDEDLR